MSELLQDDPEPDPQPSDFEYLYGREQPLPFSHYRLLVDLAERERIFLESEVVARLSAQADRIIESELGEGDLAKRHVVTENAELYRTIVGSDTKLFAFIDTLEGRRRCRAWVEGDVGVSWCEDEQRYEPADEVLARLEAVFPLVDEDKKRRYSSHRLRRLAAAVFKS